MATCSLVTFFFSFYLRRNFVNTDLDRNKFRLFTVKLISRILSLWENFRLLFSIVIQHQSMVFVLKKSLDASGLNVFIICHAWGTKASLTEHLSRLFLSRIKSHFPIYLDYIIRTLVTYITADPSGRAI